MTAPKYTRQCRDIGDAGSPRFFMIGIYGGEYVVRAKSSRVGIVQRVHCQMGTLGCNDLYCHRYNDSKVEGNEQ